MANKFLKALAAVKLVELDGEDEERAAAAEEPLDMAEIDRILAEEEAARQERAAQQPTRSAPRPASDPAPAKAAPQGTQAAPRSSGAIEEGRPFADLYLASQIPEATYSAEKLLRVLDGLKAMPASTRKAAVLAMDAADDEWSIADAVLDAQRKIRTLEDARDQVTGQLAAMKEHAAAEKQKRDLYLAEARKKVRAEIEELERKLEDEVETMTQQKAEIDARVASAESAAARETDRFSSEAERLREVEATFADSLGRPAP